MVNFLHAGMLHYAVFVLIAQLLSVGLGLFTTLLNI